MDSGMPKTLCTLSWSLQQNIAHENCSSWREGEYYTYNMYPGIPTTIKTMGVSITTIAYLRVKNHRNWVNHFLNGGWNPGVYTSLHTVCALYSQENLQQLFVSFLQHIGNLKELNFHWKWWFFCCHFNWDSIHLWILWYICLHLVENYGQM